MSDPDFAAMRERCDRATAGPWHVVEMDDDYCMSAYAIATVPNADAPPNEDSHEKDGDHAKRICLTLWQAPRIVDIADLKWEENAAFIAHARTDLPICLARIEQQEREIAELRALLEDAKWHVEDLSLCDKIQDTLDNQPAPQPGEKEAQ